MILIADSGSTKTDWRLIDDKKNVHQFRTSGLNPYFLDADQIAGLLEQELKPGVDSNKVNEIYFYGAGCSSKEKCAVVEKGIQKIFSNSKVEVEHDLIAACRSLCGNQPGIVSILGTGSNSCLYDGKDITDQVPSLGFILGDEGSGTHIGRKFLQSLFYRELPAQLVRKFDDQFHLSKDDVLETVYRKPLPNRFLASFSHFIFQNRNEKKIQEIVYGSFSEFFDRHLCKYNAYREKKIFCTGSVGYYFSEILRTVSAERGLAVGNITETPIAGLTLFHLNEQ